MSFENSKSSVQTSYGDGRIVMSDDVVACDLDGGKALLDLKSSNYFKINNTAALVWEWLGEEATLSALVEKMLAKYDVDERVVRADVEHIIASFEQSGLLEIEPVASQRSS